MREMKAVGRRWTNAVAIRTPVPKCWEMKMNLFAKEAFVDFRDIRGNPQAVVNLLVEDRVPEERYPTYRTQSQYQN